MRRTLRFLLVWMCCVLALAAFIFAVEFGLNGARRRVAFSRSWKVTTGTVFAVDRQDHLSISVRYSAEGRALEQTYEGSEKGIGDAVPVYYSPKDATVSAIRNPADSLRRDLQLLSIACLAFGTLFSCLINFQVVGEAFARPWPTFQMTPRLVMTYTATGVFIETGSNLILRHPGGRLLLADALVVGGTTLLCIRAFHVALC
jgi:uncharacterized protein DUF3592